MRPQTPCRMVPARTGACARLCPTTGMSGNEPRAIWPLSLASAPTDAREVTTGASDPHGTADVSGGTQVEAWASRRQLYLDNLKVLLVAAIIAGHGIMSYATVASFAYGDVREVTLSPITQGALLALGAPFGLFMIPLLFLIAGGLTPPSLQRKGVRAFARDRLIRLGLPFAVFTFVLWPALLYALYRPLGNAGGSYWAEFIGSADEAMDTGYLWFVGDLLIFSLVYAAWVAMRGSVSRRQAPNEVTLGRLVVLAVVVAGATFLTRLVFPFDSQKYVDLNLYQWPECIAMFVLGIVVSKQGWLTAVPTRLRRTCGIATLVVAGAFGVFTAVGAAIGGLEASTWGEGWHWDALAFAAFESGVAVFGPVWLLGASQLHLDRPFHWIGPEVSRSCYGAFLVQGLVLTALAVALRPVPFPAELKALLLAVGGVAGSFVLGSLLVSRVRPLQRVL